MMKLYALFCVVLGLALIHIGGMLISPDMTWPKTAFEYCSIVLVGLGLVLFTVAGLIVKE